MDRTVDALAWSFHLYLCETKPSPLCFSSKITMWYRPRFYELTNKCDLSFHTEGGYSCDLQILLLPAWHILTLRSPASFSLEPLGSSCLPKLICKEEPQHCRTSTDRKNASVNAFVWLGSLILKWTSPLLPLVSLVLCSGHELFVLFSGWAKLGDVLQEGTQGIPGKSGPSASRYRLQLVQSNKTKHQKHTHAHQGERGKGQILSRTCSSLPVSSTDPQYLPMKMQSRGTKFYPSKEQNRRSSSGFKAKGESYNGSTSKLQTLTIVLKFWQEQKKAE